MTHITPPCRMADEGQLVQLFQNLVGNAIKYQPAGIPACTSRAPGVRSEMGVRHPDNGSARFPVLRKDLRHVQRLHKREAFAGTGIGLAICKKTSSDTAAESRSSHSSVRLHFRLPWPPAGRLHEGAGRGTPMESCWSRTVPVTCAD